MTAASILVFAGPSLPPSARPADPRFVWLPPARAGDTLALGPGSCRCVVLIDGLFDAAPAVRHKELLLLLSHGLPLIGAASMGALRAAELDGHGMTGVGRVYSAYAQGRLVGDDEVALLHGPEETGWIALTEPLVNVRATLVRAVRERVLDPAAARRWLTLATGTFYQDRTWPLLTALAAEARLEGTDRFQDWLPEGRVDLKRADALKAIALAVAGALAPPRRPPPPATLFTAQLTAQLAMRRRLA